jgi:hypothetical protein
MLVPKNICFLIPKKEMLIPVVDIQERMYYTDQFKTFRQQPLAHPYAPRIGIARKDVGELVTEKTPSWMSLWNDIDPSVRA